MPKPKDTLDRLNINNPCTADWDEMVGNDQVRFCQHCNLDVHNLSTMTRLRALRLVNESRGRLCARYIRRPDGKIHTTDLVLHQIHTVGRRASRIAAGAFAAAVSLSSSVVAASPAKAGNHSTIETNAAFVGDSSRLNLTSGANSTLSGTIKDPNGAVIPGARITLVDEARGVERSTTSDDEGMFLLQGLEEGSYTLRIESPGFATKEITNISLGVNDQESLDETLDIEGVVLGGVIAISEPTEPLVVAAFNDDVEEVKRLLATGADVNVLDEDYDSTALGLAVSRGNLDMVTILLNAGADVNRRTDNGLTAIMNISGQTTVEIFRDLIAAGAKVDLKDETGQNALHYAAGYANIDVLKALINAGAAIDTRDQDDRTALMLAAAIGNTENVKLFLFAGASVNLRDKDGETALSLALENDCKETVEVLRNYGGTE